MMIRMTTMKMTVLVVSDDHDDHDSEDDHEHGDDDDCDMLQILNTTTAARSDNFMTSKIILTWEEKLLVVLLLLFASPGEEIAERGLLRDTVHHCSLVLAVLNLWKSMARCTQLIQAQFLCVHAHDKLDNFHEKITQFILYVANSPSLLIGSEITSWIPYYPGAKNPFHLLISPGTIPMVGIDLLGQANDMCITSTCLWIKWTVQLDKNSSAISCYFLFQPGHSKQVQNVGKQYKNTRCRTCTSFLKLPRAPTIVLKKSYSATVATSALRTNHENISPEWMPSALLENIGNTTIFAIGLPSSLV